MICSADALHRRDAPWTRCRPLWTGFEASALRMRSASCSSLEELHPGAQTHPSTISVVETVIGLPCRLAGTCDVGQSAASVTATVAKHVPAAQEQSAISLRFCWCSCRCPVLVLVLQDH